MFNNDLDNSQSIAPVGMPFSQACENNKQPILEILQQELQDFNHVLEVGSGTGQHSVYFAPRLAHLTWQTSDVSAHHALSVLGILLILCPIYMHHWLLIWQWIHYR